MPTCDYFRKKCYYCIMNHHELFTDYLLFTFTGDSCLGGRFYASGNNSDVYRAVQCLSLCVRNILRSVSCSLCDPSGVFLPMPPPPSPLTANWAISAPCGQWRCTTASTTRAWRRCGARCLTCRLTLSRSARWRGPRSVTGAPPSGNSVSGTDQLTIYQVFATDQPPVYAGRGQTMWRVKQARHGGRMWTHGGRVCGYRLHPLL